MKKNLAKIDFQSEKNLVLAYYESIKRAKANTIGDALHSFVSDDWRWRGYHPFNELNGAEQVAEHFWKPFLAAFIALQRRQDIFFAGLNEIEGYESVWVVSMGHLVGLFDTPFLRIKPTRKMAFFRYCEFNRIENARICETAFFFDLPHLMVQAELNPFATQRGAQLVQPGPITHQGLNFTTCAPTEGRATLAAINAMITDLGQWDLGLPLEQELARTWQEDMIWWGPTGIGATYTIERYAKQHSGPFRAAFDKRSKTHHICRLAEGHFGGFFGYPNFTATVKQNYLGIAPSQTVGEFRVIDLYRRGDSRLLAENWVFIDLLHWMKQNGKDILAELQ